MIPRISYKRVAEENAVNLRDCRNALDAAVRETVRLAAVAYAWKRLAQARGKLPLCGPNASEIGAVRQAEADLRELGIEPDGEP